MEVQDLDSSDEGETLAQPTLSVILLFEYSFDCIHVEKSGKKNCGT